MGFNNCSPNKTLLGKKVKRGIIHFKEQECSSKGGQNKSIYILFHNKLYNHKIYNIWYIFIFFFQKYQLGLVTCVYTIQTYNVCTRNDSVNKC